MGDAGAPPEAGPLLAGTQVAGRYTLARLLGTGGMASVWAAQDARLDRQVAVKIISDTLALDPAFVDRFDREARIAAGLSHPHVVGVHDYGTHGTRPYLVMELVAGGTLSSRLKEGRSDWDPSTLARELLDALAYIHAAGILHRDLKPANVLFGTDGRARLTDFGIAHLSDATKLTSTGFIVGTEKYLAPEVRRGEAATSASDLYALGVLLRECATASTTGSLAELTDRLTDPDLARRPRSAATALALLEGTTTHLEPTAALPASPAAPAPAVSAARPTEVLAEPRSAGHRTEAGAPPARSRLPGRVPALLAVLAVGAVLLILALSASGGGRKPLQPPPPGGTLAEQLDQLDNSIDRARR